jgi:hypothetical protein
MADRTLLIPSIEDTILQGAESVIDKSIIALNHPSGTTVNDVLYANPRNSKLDLTKLQIRNGVYKIAPTSLGIGNSISFNILNRSIVSGFYLTGSITLPAYCNLCSNWFYYLIDTLQFQMSGINNLQYTGISLRDMYLLENSKARRDYLNSDLMPAISTGASPSNPYTFIVPLSLFFNEGLLATKGFFMDLNTLSSTIQMNIQFKNLSTVVSGVTGHLSPSLPTSFDSLYMKPYAQMDHLTQEFAAHRVSNIFRVPFNFVQYYSIVNQTIQGGAHNTLQLQQLPQGETVRLILSATDASKVGASDGSQVVNYDPVKFSYLRMTLNGNDMVHLENEKQVYNQQLYNSIGDDAAMQYTSTRFANIAGVTGGQTDYNNNLTTIDCFVPAIAGSMYESEFSVAESFNGQIFQLEYQLADASITSLNWNITYLSNGIIVVENGEAKLRT